jgi:hypothetical protein
VWLASKAFKEHSGQSRFADTGLTGQQDNLTVTALCFRPAARKDFEFFFTTDKLR